MKKYEFTGETKQSGILGSVTLRRIRATVAFGIIKAGDIGGWIEKEENLSDEGNAWVYGDAKVCGNAKVYGNAKVCGNAKIFSASHVLVIGAIGSRNDFTTFYRDKDNEITVKCGCFLGKIYKFLEEVEQTHGNTKHALVYREAIEVAKLQIDCEGQEGEHLCI